MERMGRRPVLVALLGAFCIAFSGPIVRLADVTPSVAAIGRCLLAVPLLLLLSRREDRRLGPLPRRTRQLAAIAGVFFAVDLVLWHHAIDAVGAGLATVLGNLQVLFVAALAWWLLHERPSSRLLAAVPVLLLGVVLVSGVIGGEAYGEDPALGVLFGLGTSLAYAGFILLLRSGSGDLRRRSGPLLHATASAAVVAAAIGLLLGELDPTPPAASLGWLAVLAVSSQLVGWLLITSSLPRLPAAVTSVILLAQPVGAMAVSGLLLGEAPSPVQYAGAALILGGVTVATARRSGGAVEQAGDRAVLEDLGDGAPEQRGDRQHGELVDPPVVVDGQRVGDDDLADRAGLEPLHRRP
jgi:drug/metabolite transporter (DMT)-like permease